jgi:hypothetical protein
MSFRVEARGFARERDKESQGLDGSFAIEIADGEHSYTFDYSFDL